MHGDGDPPATASTPGDRWRDIGARIHGHLGATRLFLGAPDRALGHLQRTIDLCEGRLHPAYVAARLLTVAGILCVRGDLELAQTVSDRGLAVAEEHQLMPTTASAAPQRVWLAIARGEPHDAVERIRTAWADYLRARLSAATPVGPLFLLDACRLVGAADDGLAMADTVWVDTRPGGLRWYDAELQRLRGELLLLKGAPRSTTEAAACFRRALAIATEQGAKLYQLRAATSLLQLCRGRDGEADARAQLNQLYGEFADGLDTRDLRGAAALLGGESAAQDKAASTPRGRAGYVGARCPSSLLS